MLTIVLFRDYLSNYDPCDLLVAWGAGAPGMPYCARALIGGHDRLRRPADSQLAQAVSRHTRCGLTQPTPPQRGTKGLRQPATPPPGRCERQRPHGARQWTSEAQRATIVVMSIESLRSVRDHLSEFVDRVEGQHERIVLTRNGRAAAVLISPEDLAQLEETIEVLSDPAALADIREADEAYARGDVVRGVDAVRQLRR